MQCIIAAHCAGARRHQAHVSPGKLRPDPTGYFNNYSQSPSWPLQVPAAIKRTDGMPLGKYHEGLTESEFLQMFKEMASKNKVRL